MVTFKSVQCQPDITSTYLIFDIWALWYLVFDIWSTVVLGAERQSAQMSEIKNVG